MQILSSSSSQLFIQNPKPYRHKALSSNDSTFLSTALLIPKISHISVVELSKKSRSFRCRSSEHIEQQQRFSSSTRPTNNSSPLNGESFPPKVFVGHSIYKGKAALTVDPKGPEFASLDSGAFKISKEGFVLLQFAPAAGVRQYDWSRKQVFSLTVVEIGTLISLGMKDGCEFFHDPFKGRSDEGKVRKVLKVEPLLDGSGHFFNLSVQNRILNMDESIYIPVTRAEFAVLVEGFKFILPYLMDWNASASTIKPEDASRTNSANPRPGPDYESMSGADSIASNDHGVVLNWNLLPVFIWCGYVIDFMTTWSQGVGSDLGLLRKGRISGLLDPVSIFCFFPFLSSFKETLLSILLTCVLNAL